MALRYWVGGTASWDNTAGTKWALTSGGAGGQAVPTSADDVFFDAASGVNTVTISTGAIGSKSINCTGFTGTLAGTSGISVAGSITLAAGMTFSYSGGIILSGTGTITSAGKTFSGSVNPNLAGITVTLGSALTVSGGFSLLAGTLNLNGFTLSTVVFLSSNSSVRAITFGSANIALTTTSAGSGALQMANATNFTYTGTGGFTRNQSQIAYVEFGSTSGGTATNAPNLTVNAGASALTITAASHFKTLNFTGSTCTVTGTTNLYGDLTLASGGTYTALNTTFLGTANINSNGRTLGDMTVNSSGIALVLGSALTLGTTNTFTLSRGELALSGYTLSTGIFSSNATTGRTITFGTGNIALTSAVAATTVLSMATATNFTYTGTGGFTRNMAATATMVFGTTSGSVTNAPNLTVNTGASALTITASSWFNNLIFTGSTSTVTATNVNIAGDLTLATGGTYTSVASTHRDTGTLTSSGKTLSALTINGASIVVTCADALNVTNALTFTLGTLQLKAGVTSTVGGVVTSGTTLKYLESTLAGTQATISDPLGTNIVLYLSIKDSNATGGAIFTATSPTNVNAGNNTGWNFGGGGGSGNFLMMFM